MTAGRPAPGTAPARPGAGPCRATDSDVTVTLTCPGRSRVATTGSWQPERPRRPGPVARAVPGRAHWAPFGTHGRRRGINVAAESESIASLGPAAGMTFRAPFQSGPIMIPSQDLISPKGARRRAQKPGLISHLQNRCLQEHPLSRRREHTDGMLVTVVAAARAPRSHHWQPG